MNEPFYEGRSWLSFDPRFAATLHQLDRIGSQGEYAPDEAGEMLSDRLAAAIPMIGRAEDGILVILEMLRDAGLMPAATPTAERIKADFRTLLEAARLTRTESDGQIRSRLDQLFQTSGHLRVLLQDLEILWRDSRAASGRAGGG